MSRHLSTFDALLPRIVVLVGFLASGASAIAGQAVQSAREFADAAPTARKTTLNDLAAHRLVLPVEDLGEVLTVSLQDKDEDIRKRAVYAIAGRAGGLRFAAMQPPGQPLPSTLGELAERWRSEHATLLALRDRVVSALTDGSPDVRKGAVIALLSLEYEPEKQANYAVRPETLELLAARFDKETAPTVRKEIVKTMALTSTKSKAREALLRRALSDADRSVLQYAVMGAGEARLSDTLPRLAELLSHSDRSVRLNAVQAIAVQGQAAEAYRPQLEQALGSETDQVVRKSIEGALTTMSRTASGKQD